MRAGQRALVALDAVVGDPTGNVNRDAAFFILGGAGRNRAVRAELGDGKAIARLREHRPDEFRKIRIVGGLHGNRAVGGIHPGFRILDFFDRIHAKVDRVPVLFDDFVALLTVGLLRGCFHVIDGFFHRDHVGELEEGTLHDGVDASTHADFARKFDRVDVVEAELLLRDGFLEGSGQFAFHFGKRPRAVEQEHAAFFDAFRNRITGYVAGVMAGHKVRVVDQIRALDRLLAKAEVRNGQTAGLLGVVGEITLHIQRCMITDDLDGVFVCANGAVRAEAEEFARNSAFRRGVNLTAHGERSVGHVVVDADGEVVLRLLGFGVFEYRCHHGRREFFATEAIASANDFDIFVSGLNQRVEHVLIQRFAKGAGLLRAIEHRKALDALGERAHELCRNERTIEADFEHTELRAVFVKVFNGFFRNIRATAHDDEHGFCIRRADIVKEVILASGELCDFAHVMLHDAGNRVIILVGCFAALEVDVRVLCRATLMRVIGVQRAGTEGLDRLGVEEFAHVFIVDGFDLGDFVGGAESIKEMKERHAALDCGKVRNKRHVHNFLHGSGGKHGKTGLAAAHHVRMIAKDRQRVRSQCTGADMEHAREEFAGDLVHVRDHEQQALRSGKRRGQRACLEGAMHRTSGAALTLHFSNANLLSEKIGSSVCRPIVRNFCHGRRRRDRVNRRYVRKCIRNVRRGGITVDCHGFCHLVDASLDMYGIGVTH